MTARGAQIIELRPRSPRYEALEEWWGLAAQLDEVRDALRSGEIDPETCSYTCHAITTAMARIASSGALVATSSRGAR